MKYLKKILNILTKKGKKTFAVKTVRIAIKKLKRVRLIPSRLNRVFDRLVPAVKITKKKVAGKVYQIPAIITKQRALFQTSKWITEAVDKEKKGKKLEMKLCKVIYETARKKGLVWKLRKQYLAVIRENRSYMRFIRKKRKKKKIKIFKQSIIYDKNKAINSTHKEYRR